MACRHGSSLADWPISYDDLAAYYERAEWEIGVAGDSAAQRATWQRERDYPMPPVPLNRQGAACCGAVPTALGWNTFSVPLLINSVPYGRPRRPASTASTASASPARWTPRTARTTP